jgi:hypothetical protein
LAALPSGLPGSRCTDSQPVACDRLLPIGTNRAGLVLRLLAQGIERLSQPAE